MRPIRFSFPSSLVLFLLTIISPTTLVAQQFNSEQLQSRIYSAIDTATPAVVAITENGGTFSGVIVSPEGHVLSAGHAVRPGRRYNVMLADGRRLRAQGLGSNSSSDCAMLKISNESGLPYAQLGNSNQLVINQPCLSISHPGRFNPTRGPVVRFGRVIKPITSNRGMIQSSALMEPGDSGGALFDLSGRVIAIHSRIGTSVERNYDVPINTFKQYWDELLKPNSFQVNGSPGLPKLGFSGENTARTDGVVILEIKKDSPAEKAGFKVDDVIRVVRGKRVTSSPTVFRQLIEARSRGEKNLKVVVDRETGQKELTVAFTDFDTPSPDIPGVAKKPSSTTPKAIRELESLPKQFSKIESKLDDRCMQVVSSVGNQQTTINATLLADSPLMVSKSSMVGPSPSFTVAGEKYPLEIVARDSENDLVLLRSPLKNKIGVDLKEPDQRLPSIGRFLVTADPDGPGMISVWSTREFASRKSESKGFLGVVPADSDQGVLLQRVDRGAARTAGLKTGDVIVKLNDTQVTRANDLRRFLQKTDPNNTISATFLRDDKEMKADIVLGAPPETSRHVASNMDKSGRRDGFTLVMSHDADLQPDECGSPLFDLAGNFVGLNIARNSRVRSYAIPKSVIKTFVMQNR